MCKKSLLEKRRIYKAISVDVKKTENIKVLDSNLMLWENQGLGIERDTHLWGRSRVYSSCATGGQVCSGSRSNPGWWCRKGSTTTFLCSPGDPPTLMAKKHLMRYTTEHAVMPFASHIASTYTTNTQNKHTTRAANMKPNRNEEKPNNTVIELINERERETYIWLFCSLVHRDIYFMWNSLDLDRSGCCGVEARKPLVSFRLAVGAERHRQGAVLQQANQPHRVAALRVAQRGRVWRRHCVLRH